MSMERDTELIRNLLIDFKNNYRPGSNITPSTQKEDYHMYLLVDSGFIEAGIKKNKISLPIYTNLMITSTGHDFLEAAENDTVWNKAKESIKEKGIKLGSVPIDVLKEYLKMEMKKHLGI